MPKVSIVLPNYNYDKYLDQRIKSLLDQTYKDFELVIVDDASTDCSLEIIEKYNFDSRIKTKFYSENSGLPYKRWNDGASFANGEYILFAGADDSCKPTLIEELVNRLDEKKTIGLAYSQSIEIDSFGKFIRSLKITTDDLDRNKWSQDYTASGREELKYLIVKNTIPNASCVLLRRDTFEEVGKFDVQLRLVADWLLYSKMLLVSDIAFISEPLNYWRIHRKTVRSKSQQTGKHILEELQVVDWISKQVDIPSSFLDLSYNRIVNRWVNSTVRLMLTKPGMVKEQTQSVFTAANEVVPDLSKRLSKRVIKDISTAGLLTLRERGLRR